MSGIISKESLSTIENLRTGILKAAIWILVGGVVLGVFTILFGGSSSNEVAGKFMGTLFIIALMMIVCVNNFKMMMVEEASVQVFAIVGAISNIICALLWILLCWNPIWGYDSIMHGTSTLFKFALAFFCLSMLGLIGSNVMALYEGEKRGMIRPLKITAVVCATYEMLYFTIVIFSGIDYTDEFAKRLATLAGFVGSIWFIIVIAAVIISRNEQAKQKKGTNEAPKQDVAPSKPKTEEELRAEIEEKVRREMIEKEVRERMEKEMGNGGNSGSLGV